jgi:transposase-like protein
LTLFDPKKEANMNQKLSLNQVRYFSLELKKYIVQQIENGELGVTQASRAYDIAITTVYKWLYKYSKNLKKGTRIVVEKNSIDKQTAELKKQIKDLQAALGRKSLQVDLYEHIIELASKEYDTDLKKSFGDKVSITTKSDSK